MIHKKLFYLLLILALNFVCHSSFSQENPLNKKYDLQVSNEPLYKTLIKLNQETGLNFSYNASLIDGDKKISINKKNAPLKEIIDAVLTDTSLTFEVFNKHLIIYKKNEKPAFIDKEEKKITSIKIKGEIHEKGTKKPLPYASIGLLNKPIGTMANLDGEFVIKIDPKHIDDTIVVSHIGYANQYIPVKLAMNRINNIKLEKKYYTIQEVIIRSNSPRTILMNSLSRIQENYYDTPLLLTGFYRETVQKDEGYTSVSEAIIKLYRPHGKIFRGDQVKIMKSRKSINYNTKDSVMLKLKAGLEATFLLDVINDRANFLQIHRISLYKYELSDISFYNGNDTYVISFSPKEEAPIPLYKGKLYIDVNSLAIVAAKFSLDKNNLKKVASSLIIRKKWDIKVKPQEVEYFVSYKKSKTDKYYLNHIRGDLTFKVKKRDKFFGQNFKVSFEMATSNVETENVSPFERQSIIRAHKIFIEQIEGYDADFWEDYNIIKPGEPVKETLENIKSKIQKLPAN